MGSGSGVGASVITSMFEARSVGVCNRNSVGVGVTGVGARLNRVRVAACDAGFNPEL